jgi:hypothetical protein
MHTRQDILCTLPAYLVLRWCCASRVRTIFVSPWPSPPIDPHVLRASEHPALSDAVSVPMAAKQRVAELAEVFQRSSANVKGHNGYLAFRNHELRRFDHPRKRTCLKAVHNFLRTRPDGSTAAERFFGPKPRSMFAAILKSVGITPILTVRCGGQSAGLQGMGWPTWVSRPFQR